MKTHPLVYILILSLIILLTACSPVEAVEMEENQTAPGETVQEVETAGTEQAATITANAENDADAGETEVSPDEDSEAMAEEPVDECVACHTDQQLLIDTAKSTEAMASESEGEG